MKFYYLYKITNVLNRKVYIGQSVNPNGRWRKHRSDARIGKNQLHLYKAMRKYGLHNFIFETIAQAKSLENIDVLETICIQQYNSSNRKYGYNIALGGNGKRIVSEETKKKLSKINTGKIESQETRDRKSESMLGKNKGSDNGMFGKRSLHAKLTKNQADAIRLEYSKDKVSSIYLANKYNVSKKTIWNILHNKIYN